MKATIAESVHDATRAEWDALAGEDDPFAEHAFFAALEDSGSVCEATGWRPQHVLVRDDGGVLVGALPLYLKTHSYGEYIFDFAWANGAHRAGLAYYPKLVSMAPVTPATGTRLLVAPGDERPAVVRAMLDAACELAEARRASSVHLLFLSVGERDEVCLDARFAPRLSSQFHFTNEGYESFDDFLSRFRSPARKQIKRERRIVAESGLTIRTLSGGELSRSEWQALRRFYVDTCRRKGSPPYLREGFFERIAETFAARVVAVLAYEDGAPIAGTLSFEKGAQLYGRYWGADAHAEMLHFELCYYRLIDRAIEKGMRRFEAGAQGEHKLKRGLMPSAVHSAHLIRHARLDEAVRDYLAYERSAVERELVELGALGPFRRDGV